MAEPYRTVELAYRAPVSVVVNIDKRTIERVHVWDEDVSLDETPADSDSAEAIAIAEDAMTEWPAWRFGH